MEAFADFMAILILTPFVSLIVIAALMNPAIRFGFILLSLVFAISWALVRVVDMAAL